MKRNLEKRSTIKESERRNDGTCLDETPSNVFHQSNLPTIPESINTKIVLLATRPNTVLSTTSTGVESTQSTFDPHTPRNSAFEHYKAATHCCAQTQPEVKKNFRTVLDDWRIRGPYIELPPSMNAPNNMVYHKEQFVVGRSY